MIVVPFQHYMKAEKYETHIGREVNYSENSLDGDYVLKGGPEVEIVPYVEKLCNIAMNEKFVVGPNVASWLDVRGFHIHKMCSRNPNLDVMVIEPVGNSDSYIAVDMGFKSMTVWAPATRSRFIRCKVWKILENNLLPEDEFLLKLTL